MCKACAIIATLAAVGMFLAFCTMAMAADVEPVPIVAYKYECQEQADAQLWRDLLYAGDLDGVVALFASPTSSCYRNGPGLQVGIPDGTVADVDGQEVLVIGAPGAIVVDPQAPRFRVTRVHPLAFPLAVMTDRLLAYKVATQGPFDWVNRSTSYTVIPRYHDDQVYPEGDCITRMDCPLPAGQQETQKAELEL